MLCKRCNKEFSEDWRRDSTTRKTVPAFCSRSCANSRVFSEKSIQKKSETLKKEFAKHPEWRERSRKAAEKTNSRKDTVHIQTIQKDCCVCGKSFTTKSIRGRITCSTECYHKRLSQICKEKNFGGHTSKLQLRHFSPFAGEVYLQSGWEMLCAKLLDLLEIDWCRPGPFTWIDDENVEHKYYPDFFLKKKGIYVDTKNPYLQIKDADKIQKVREQNKIDLRVIGIDRITEDYITNI